MERLNYEDAFVMEIVVDKINSIIEELEVMKKGLTERIDNNWKHHKQLSRRLEALEEALLRMGGGKGESKTNNNAG